MSGMNAGIILAGRQADPIGSFARGQAARAASEQYGQQNALRNLYQTQGQGILSGDQNALNALAQVDPGQALAFQGQHQIQNQRSATMEHQRAAAKRQAEQYAKSLSAEQAAAQAAQIEQGMTRAIGAYKAGDLNAVNQILQSAGEQPIQSLEQFPAVAAIYGDVLDTLKTVNEVTAGPKPADEYGRYVAEEKAAGRTPMNRIDFKRSGQKTTRTQVGADGSVSVVEGFGDTQTPPKLTVDAGKNTGFLIRLNDSQEILNNLEDEGLSFFQQNAERLPMGTGNYVVSGEFQKFDQARRDFINAILRRESGAVISDQEFENAEIQYFPRPGDSPEVIAQKRQNRANAIAGVRAGAGEGAGYVDQLQQPTTEAVDPGSGPQYQFENDQQKTLFDKYAVPSG